MMTLATAQNQPEAIPPRFTVPFSSLYRSDLNPRKQFDPTDLEDLAQSILEHDLLQPLLVRPHPDDLDSYEIVAGERRHRALEHLILEDKLEPDYPVAVNIRHVSDVEALVLATTENIQRQNMTPLEEADAFLKLVDLGEDETGIALKTGVAVSTVKLRLRLASSLSVNARKALEQGKLLLSQAQALLMVSKGMQNELLSRVIDFGYSPRDIKRLITQDKIPVGRNLFPLEAYTQAKGSILQDLFDDEQPGWFDSVELFIKLQNEAIQTKLSELKEQYSVVEATDQYYHYAYVSGDGAVLELNPYTYEVVVHEGVLRRPDLNEDRADKANQPRINRRRNEWEATSLTRAVHVEASKDYRLCLILNIMILLGIRGFDVTVKPDKTSKHRASNQIFDEDLKQAFDAIRQELSPENAHQQQDDDSYYPLLEHLGDEDISMIFQNLSAKSDEVLHTLFAKLTATLISHGHDDTPWNTIIKQIVMEEMQLDISQYVDASNADYLTLHTKTELAELANEVALPLDVMAMKKSVAVEYLAQHDKVKAYVPERLFFQADPSDS